MAELALGGFELAIKQRTRPGGCLHESALSVTAAGVERSICETCGHVSVRFVSAITGPVYRDLFSRPADQAAESPQENPFADRPRLGLRSRERREIRSVLLTA